jgi:hypothetical protein
MGTSALGKILTDEDMEIFTQEVLGVVGQYFFLFRILDINPHAKFRKIFPPATTAEEAKATRKAAFLVALFSIAGTAITLLFAPGHPPILFPPCVALFFYTFYPAYKLWRVAFQAVQQRYYTEYGQLGILREPTLKEALEVCDASRVGSLALHLAIVVCAVLALIWLKSML